MEETDRGALSHAESERALRVASILGKAEQPFGDKAKADAWLRRPTLALGGRRPIDLLDCETEAHLVEQLLIELTTASPPDAPLAPDKRFPEYYG